MRTIWKYALPLADRTEIEMPTNAEIICAGEQTGWLMVWAMVDPDAPESKRAIRIIGTGHPIPDADNLRYIGTVPMANGHYIWHVFEEV